MQTVKLLIQRKAQTVKKKPDDLDTETTFADMNVDGFKWYDPSKKKKGMKNVTTPVSRKEYWAMVRGAFLAALPFIIGIVAIFGIVYLIAYLWL